MSLESCGEAGLADLWDSEGTMGTRAGGLTGV